MIFRNSGDFELTEFEIAGFNCIFINLNRGGTGEDVKMLLKNHRSCIYSLSACKKNSLKENSCLNRIQTHTGTVLFQYWATKLTGTESDFSLMHRCASYIHKK